MTFQQSRCVNGKAVEQIRSFLKFSRENQVPCLETFTCLLIDDDIDDHEIFSAVIDTVAPEWKRVTALNGHVALTMLQSREVNPDIVFLDLNMPLMNGRQFLQEVGRQKILEEVPIIVLTTSSDQHTKSAVLELGATQFVTKPDKFSDWEKVLKQVIDKWV